MKFIRFLTAALTVFSLTSCMSGTVRELPEDTIVLLAGSDLQHASGYESAVRNVKKILGAILDAGYDHADGAFFCGDYNWDFGDSVSGLANLRLAVREKFPMKSDNILVVQGNHDSAEMPGLSPAGANDTENYGVFILHEDDYMLYNDQQQTVKETSERLKVYLDEKIEQKDTRPIFVLAHLPLHYSMRTYYQNDACYANYIFDVLNSAAEHGLNLFYLFGHNHSYSWDDYLGGSAIYLAKGDTICIAQESSLTYKEETLAFTYLNAGYTGYYYDINPGAETDLSMTVFRVTDESVTIERYTADGLHDLKSPGVRNDFLSETQLTGLSPDKRTYESPQIIPLNKEIIP